MIIRKVRPSWYLSGLMVCWGVINMCMGFVQTYQGLVVLRFFLGVFEAGVMPGIIYLTSMYYKRHEFQTRMSFFFCSTLIGGAFGGVSLLALTHSIYPSSISDDVHIADRENMHLVIRLRYF